MNEKINELVFRTLNANEIDVRVGNIARDNKGFSLLLYKNARVDQCILDETFGAWNWQCRYYQVKNTMVCSVGIRKDENSEWIWKDNGGDDDFQAEQVKAELSDSFKRACFNWGIGRELYYSPKIWVDANDNNTSKSRYSVKVIDYDNNKRIKRLAIINDKTKEVVFLYGEKEKDAQNGEKEPKQAIPSVSEPKGSIENNDLKLIQAYISAMDKEEKRQNFYDWLEQKFGTLNVETLTKSQGKWVLDKLNGRKK